MSKKLIEASPNRKEGDQITTEYIDLCIETMGSQNSPKKETTKKEGQKKEIQRSVARAKHFLAGRQEEGCSSPLVIPEERTGQATLAEVGGGDQEGSKY